MFWLVFHFEEYRLDGLRARVLQAVERERRRAHRRGNAHRALQRHGHRRTFVAAGVDGHLVTLEEVDEVVAVVVHRVLLARLHRQHARDPLGVLRQLRVARRRDVERALEAVKKRKNPVRSWYLDISLIEKYWSAERVYHHTSSSTLNYALLEALLLIHEEGMGNRFARHLKNHKALVAGVEALGLKMLVSPQFRLPTLNTVLIPEGVDDIKLRRYLLEKFKLDIGGGFGRLKGKVWRVGLMGYSSSADNVLFFIPAISRALALQGYKTDLAAGLDAVLSELDGNGNHLAELRERTAVAAL